MPKSEVRYRLKDFIDTHLHTAPDTIPRKLTDIDAASMARENEMGAIILKSHLVPTVGRANIASHVTKFKVLGGIVLNKSVGGLNTCALRSSALQGGKIVWLPTIHHPEIDITPEKMEPVLELVLEYDMVLATGHISPEKILQVLDQAKSMGLKKIMVNHPLTRVVGASISQQKEMATKAYLEHCYVACRPQHDGLDPAILAQAIREVGPRHCIMATDFGQIHNPTPVEGIKMFIDEMLQQGISWKSITTMCRNNPQNLFL
jgi:hypothetical protein